MIALPALHLTVLALSQTLAGSVSGSHPAKREPGAVRPDYFAAGEPYFAASFAAGASAFFFGSSAGFFCAACRSSTVFCKLTTALFRPSIWRLAASSFC